MTDEASAIPTKRPLFFYGWRIVALGYILNLMTAGVGATGFSVFVKPMGDDLGWSRSSIIAATTASMAAAAIFGHLIGSLLDKRYGARLVTTLGMSVIGLGMIGAGQVREVWQFLLIFFVAGAFGLNAYPALIIPTIVSKWFVRKRGMAISFASMGLSSSGLLISPYAVLLITSLTWRAAWVILGITTLALTVPWCFLFMRSRPEDLGLLPDGDPESACQGPEEKTSREASEEEYPWTIREAIRTRTFWLVLVASSLAMMSFMGVLINFFAFATDPAQGFSDG
ncbi:MAG: MFS transporter, partial [Dehalococcoidia bacterium]